MKTPNHTWIKYPKLLENTIQHGSLILDFVPDYHPEWNLILKGEVHSSPEKNDFRIQDKLQDGDVIYFKYIVADEENMHEEEIWESTESFGMTVKQKVKRNYLRVPMNDIFCYVRDGEIIPYGGHVLAKSIFDDDIEEIEVEGKMIPAKLSKSGLVTDLDVSFRENLSKIIHIGLPLDGGEELELSPGEVVVMEKMSHHKYTIEDVEYFVFHQDDILATADV
tara:strand:- start:294 stop:959 length:666 start_codon:yes stop_codon:yes gene_type:complete